MDELCKQKVEKEHYAREKKYHFLMQTLQSREICRDREQSWWLRAVGLVLGKTGEQQLKEMIFFGGDENVLKLTVVMAACICGYSPNR